MLKSLEKPHNTLQGGFAVAELLIVIGIASGMLAITASKIDPAKQLGDARNVARQVNESAILDAIEEYEIDHEGNEPASLADVTSTPEPLAEGIPGAVDLCSALVPNYLESLPIDPSTGSIVGGNSPCDSKTTSYTTGYTIFQSNDERFTISVNGENGVGTISTTR
jgi:type II secretory pathway pseudopilin PulG